MLTRSLTRRSALKLSCLLCLSLFVGLASGCDCDVPRQNSPVGTWNVRNVNGQLQGTDLPGGISQTVTASTLTISRDGRYNEVVYYTTDSASVIQNDTLTDVGTWKVSENCGWGAPDLTVVTFYSQTHPDWLSYQGQVIDDTLVQFQHGHGKYVRQ